MALTNESYFLLMLYNCPFSVFIAPTFEQSSFTVDEGDGSVQVCMHLGGEALSTSATFTVYNNSALSKFCEYLID